MCDIFSLNYRLPQSKQVLGVRQRGCDGGGNYSSPMPQGQVVKSSVVRLRGCRAGRACSRLGASARLCCVALWWQVVLLATLVPCPVWVSSARATALRPRGLRAVCKQHRSAI